MLVQRFIVVGDMHKSYPNTSSTSIVGTDYRGGPPTQPIQYSDRFDLLIQNLRAEKEGKGLDFVVFNGDIIHSGYSNRTELLNEIKESVDIGVGVPLYAGYGNHDRASDSEWVGSFGHNRSHSFSVGDYGYIVLNTSDTAGARQICRDEEWLSAKLLEHQSKEGVFVFAHIPRYSGVRADSPYDSPQCDATMDLFFEQDNLKGVFHSHFHEEDRLFKKGGKNFIHTGHFAHYGLDYYGYRIVEIYGNGKITTTQYNVTDSKDRYFEVLSDTEPVDREAELFNLDGLYLNRIEDRFGIFEVYAKRGGDIVRVESVTGKFNRQ